MKKIMIISIMLGISATVASLRADKITLIFDSEDSFISRTRSDIENRLMQTTTKSSVGADIIDETAVVQKIIVLIKSGAQNIEQKNWKAALADYNNAIDLYSSLSDEIKAVFKKSDAKIVGTLYSQRGFCEYRLHDIEGADSDWKIADQLGYRGDEAVKQAKSERFSQIAEGIVDDFENELNERAEKAHEREATRAENRRDEEMELGEESSITKTITEGLAGIAASFRQNNENIREIMQKREEEKRLMIEEDNQRKQQILKNDQEQVQKRKEEQERQRAEQERQRKEQEEAERKRQEKLLQEAKDDELNAVWSPIGRHTAGRQGTCHLITPKNYDIAIMSWRIVEEKEEMFGIAMIAEYYINNQSRYVTIWGGRGTWWKDVEVAGTTGDKLYLAKIPPKGEYRGRARIDMPKSWTPSRLHFLWNSGIR